MLSRFPIRVQLVGRYFWQSGQKLDENNKINILGAKLGDMGRGQATFWGSGGTSTSPLTNGNTAHYYQRNQETT